MKDSRDSLSSTLQSWPHEPAPSPDFSQQVWIRIRTSETARPHSPLLHFPNALQLAASVAVMLSLAAGSSTAFALNHTRTNERNAAAYVRTIDPVQMTATASHVHP